MARFFLLLFVIQTVLAALALIGCLSAEKDQIRALPRFAWVLIILLLPLVGAGAWFLAGRTRGPGRSHPGRSAGTAFPRRRSARPVAPDDDPEFLNSLADRSRQQDQELFRRWEEDLRRREHELRSAGDEPPAEPRRSEGEPPREEDRPEV